MVADVIANCPSRCLNLDKSLQGHVTFDPVWLLGEEMESASSQSGLGRLTGAGPRSQGQEGQRRP